MCVNINSKWQMSKANWKFWLKKFNTKVTRLAEWLMKRFPYRWPLRGNKDAVTRRFRAGDDGCRLICGDAVGGVNQVYVSTQSHTVTEDGPCLEPIPACNGTFTEFCSQPNVSEIKKINKFRKFRGKALMREQKSTTNVTSLKRFAMPPKL